MADHAAALPQEAAPSRLHGWYKELSTSERHGFWACFAGWGLDGTDLKLYGYMIPTLMAVWGITRGDAGSMATAALLSSAVGGWAGGWLADRYGRARMLQVSILWYSFFTLLCAFANSYAQLFTLRLLYGLGFGAEWGVGAALIGEMIRDRYRATASGTVHSAWAVGGGIAAILYAITFSLFPPALAWRVLFGIGVLPALLIFYVRRTVKDSPIYLESRTRRASDRGAQDVLAIFSPELAGRTVLGAIICVGCLGGAYATQTWLPTYLRSARHLSVVNTSGFIVMFEVAHFFGYIFGAYLADIIGRRSNFILMSLVSSITLACYMLLPIGNTATFLLGIPLGFFTSGTYSGIGAILNELYPTRVRGAGIGFCFNFGRGIGAVFPLLVGVLSAALPLGQAIGAFTVSAYGLVVIGALLLPETKGRSLPA